MKPDELDRIFLSEKRMEASPSFAREVMARVGSEAFYRRRFPFPWIPFAAITLVLAIFAVWVFPADWVLRGTYRLSYTIGQWIMAPPVMDLGSALLPALAALVGTFLLVWMSLRLVEAGN
jgi:hypothetical protein